MSPSAKRTVSMALRRSALLRWPLRVAARVLAPRHHVGAVGAVFDDRGRVLLVEHTFRTDYPWGLPGGWVSRGEHPSDAVRRELVEELHLEVDVGELLLSELIGVVATSTHPPHLGFAYYCRLAGGEPSLTGEVLAIEWCDPTALARDVAPFQRRAAELGHEVFLRERSAGCRA